MATMDMMPSTEKSWLLCRLDKGMFSDEFVVTYPSTGTPKKSVFVPAADVEGEPGTRGKVRVMVMRRDGKLLAVLPSTEHDIVEVADDADVSGV